MVRWFGCIGMALSSLAFYYIPQHFGHNFAMALLPAIALGIFVAAFVPLAAVFQRWSRSTKARPFRYITCRRDVELSRAGHCGDFATVLQHHRGGDRLYRAVRGGFFLCAFIRVEQPGFPTRKRRPASRWSSLIGDAAGMPGMPALIGG